MEKDFNFYINTLCTLFEDGFKEAYVDANARKRRRLLPYVPSLHRRWFYSALIENTPFTPANIVDAMAAHFGVAPGVFPQPVVRGASKFSGFDVHIAHYGGVHPVMADMAALLGYCAPHVDIQTGDYFFDAQMLALAPRLSIPEPAYASFLLDVAFEMKLLRKKPSLRVNRVEPAKDAAARLAAEPAALFGDIVHAAVGVSARHISALVALPEPLFTESFIRAMLTEPIETDSLFERVYDVLGYTLEDLVALSIGPDGPDLESEEGAFLAGTFMMGLVLDQHFYTPFGYFLKLIKPHYVLPFEFEGEIEDFLDTRMESSDEVFIAFFAPCSSYTLTELGLRTLNVARTEDNFYDVQKYMPFDLLKDSLFSDPEMIGMLVKMAQLLPPPLFGGRDMQPVYTFRVRAQETPDVWMHLHICADDTLCDLYDEILLYFPLRENGDFSFFHDATENKFAEYPAPKRAKPRAKKTADIALGDLDFDRQPKLMLTAYNQALPFAGKSSSVRFELEMLGVKKPDPAREYPYGARFSKAMKAQLDGEAE